MEGAMVEIRPYFQLVAAPPFFKWKCVDGHELELIGGPRPGVKRVAAPPFGCDDHIIGPLAMRIAVKSGVAERRAEKRAGAELIVVGSPDPRAPPPFVRRGGLGDERSDVGELMSIRKSIHVKR